jgi:GST-like protein
VIDLYAWSTPNPVKVGILLEELGLEYQIILLDPVSPATKTPEFLRLNPNGKIPVIVDHDASPPRIVFESGAILVYLAEKARSEFLPREPDSRSRTFEWLMIQLSGIGPMLGQLFHFRMAAKEELPYAIRRYEDEMHRLFALLDRRLTEAPYLAGETYTIADMATYPWWAKFTPAFRVDTSRYPHVELWAARIAARPAVQRAMKIGA